MGRSLLWSSEIETVCHPGHDQASATGETLRRCVCHQRSRPAARGHHHLWQSLSGICPSPVRKQDGLDGSRSSLFYEAIRIVKEMRCATNEEYPRFIVWENVPGAFSSNKGQDFKAVLEAVIGVKANRPPRCLHLRRKGWPDADYYVGDGWSVAYRVLDAQWWGVPQKRKRIYLVADFGGHSAGEILFESEGVSRYSAEGFHAWQRAAAGAESGTERQASAEQEGGSV